MLFHSSPSRCNLHSFPTRRSSDLEQENVRPAGYGSAEHAGETLRRFRRRRRSGPDSRRAKVETIRRGAAGTPKTGVLDRKSTRLNSSHRCISYAVFCLKKKKKMII